MLYDEHLLRPGKARHKYLVINEKKELLSIFRTDDPQCTSLVKSFAEDYIRNISINEPGQYEILYENNDAKINERVRRQYIDKLIKDK